MAPKNVRSAFTKKEIEEIKSLGGFEELMKTLEQRLREQKNDIKVVTNG